MKWEYHSITLQIEHVGEHQRGIDESHVQKLDAFGAEGWELVAVAPVPNMDSVLRDVMYVFKRPVTPSRWNQ